MIYVSITASEIVEFESPKFLKGIVLESERGDSRGWESLSYIGDFDGLINKLIEFKGNFKTSDEIHGSGNFGIIVDGNHILHCGGQFSHVPLTVSIFIDSLSIWLAIHVQSAQFNFPSYDRTTDQS